MKKLLELLGAINLSTIIVSNVIACEIGFDEKEPQSVTTKDETKKPDSWIINRSSTFDTATIRNQKIDTKVIMLQTIDKKIIELASTDLNITKLIVAIKNLQEYKNVIKNEVILSEDLILKNSANSVLSNDDAVANNDIITVNGKVQVENTEKDFTFTVKIKEIIKPLAIL